MSYILYDRPGRDGHGPSPAQRKFEADQQRAAKIARRLLDEPDEHFGIPTLVDDGTFRNSYLGISRDHTPSR
jgi:hypothetical protein